MKRRTIDARKLVGLLEDVITELEELQDTLAAGQSDDAQGLARDVGGMLFNAQVAYGVLFSEFGNSPEPLARWDARRLEEEVRMRRIQKQLQRQQLASA